MRRSSRWSGALKDVDPSLGAADNVGLPLLAALSPQWHAAVAAGHGRQDIGAARPALGRPGRWLAERWRPVAYRLFGAVVKAY